VYPIVLVSARLFGVSMRGSIIAAVLASSIWWFDGFVHWMWFVGMVCWAFAGTLVLLPLALFVAFLRDRRRAHLVALAPILALTHTVHPYSFFVLAAPMLILYYRARRELSRNEHLAIVGVALLTVVAHLWWLRVAVRFWHYILDSGYYLDATPDFFLWDWLGFTKDAWVTGVIANRTGFRFLAIGLAIVAVVQLRRARDSRFAWIAAALVVPFFIAYVGGATPVLRQVQPYRFVAPAVMLCTVLAGAAVDGLIEPVLELFRDGRRSVMVATLGVAAFVAAPRLLRDVFYYLPSAIPERGKALPLAPPNVNGAIGFGSIRWPTPLDFRPIGATPLEVGTIEIIKKIDDGSGRFLIEWWAFGEQLAGRTNAQVLGGFREINLAHSDSNFFRVQPENKPIDPQRFQAYLEAFNVKWIALMRPWPEIDARHDLLELVPNMPGARWYRVKKPSGWIVGGGPGTVRASNDRLEVRGSAGGSLVLRYHYLETLRCKPGCTVRREPSPLTRVGFIAVDGAPSDFEIVNPP
jgi:hypothetical protein